MHWHTAGNSRPWGLRKYKFPPASLFAQVLSKIWVNREQVWLVAPFWPNQTLFAELSLLATVLPGQILLRKDLLSQRQSTIWHESSDLLNIHVWPQGGMQKT